MTWKRWHKRRRGSLIRILMKRDGGGCYYCGRYLLYEDTTLDHKVPKAEGGSDRKSNLVVSCRPCNEAKGAMSAAEFKAQLRRERREQG